MSINKINPIYFNHRLGYPDGLWRKFMAVCKFCGAEIFWMKEGKKNRPVEADGALHECSEMKKSFKSVKVIKPGSLSPEEIAKYEQDINKAHEKYKDKGKKKS